MLWLDTYFEWIAPHSECCFFSNETDEFCHYENETCRPCVTNLTQNGWPYPSDFNKYLQYFLIDNPGKHCPSGGHAAFGAGVKLKDDNETVRSKSPHELPAIALAHCPLYDSPPPTVLESTISISLCCITQHLT